MGICLGMQVLTVFCLGQLVSLNFMRRKVLIIMFKVKSKCLAWKGQMVLMVVIPRTRDWALSNQVIIVLALSTTVLAINWKMVGSQTVQDWTREGLGVKYRQR